MEDVIVLYSTPEHLNSISFLATFITKHNPISVVVLSTAAAIPAASSITYRRLPTPALPPNSNYNHIELFYEIPRLNNPNLQQALREISQKSKIKAIILDFFCNCAFEVCRSFNVPTFFCNTTGASGLCLLLYWPTIHENNAADQKMSGLIEVPGCPLFRPLDLPEMLNFPRSLIYKHLLDTSKNVIKSDGIIVNTFSALELRAVEAIKTGLCVPNGPTPAVYPLGPLIAGGNRELNNGGGGNRECLRWLDLQRGKSVIFLCFGRRGVFSIEQLKEIATGLENSGSRFLWALRINNPPGKMNSEPDLADLLPEGFLERVKERGVVLKNWAPQTEVMSHDSVGGFVTHCGQSSVLEAVAFGVPMIGWPLYAEQRMNRVVMVEEMKVALPLEETAEGLVKAAELEKRVRELMMESKKGREIRRRVAELKYAAAAAVEKGGTSLAALGKLMEKVNNS